MRTLILLLSLIAIESHAEAPSEFSTQLNNELNQIRQSASILDESSDVIQSIEVASKLKVSWGLDASLAELKISVIPQVRIRLQAR
ncbi:MAG: hypothetical protein COT73_06440 [Bdellovibrio sp. CG10_big_fil_rev_8_21_14_0_10_47_8]|nr:MAG: hypothetical protein COT73_06440 [Bdellovibrio sp. CG10_big_fil_rev_8_21_14_0_10_47_8]